MTEKIVVDTSVFNKLFLNEPNRDTVIELFRRASLGDIELLAPSLLFIEVISTVQYYRLPLEPVIDLLEEQINVNLKLVSITAIHRTEAVKMIKKGHPKSGYPSIYDSIFHALALLEEAIFLTADVKYFKKTKQMNNILLLNDLKF